MITVVFAEIVGKLCSVDVQAWENCLGGAAAKGEKGKADSAARVPAELAWGTAITSASRLAPAVPAGTTAACYALAGRTAGKSKPEMQQRAKAAVPDAASGKATAERAASCAAAASHSLEADTAGHILRDITAACAEDKSSAPISGELEF